MSEILNYLKKILPRLQDLQTTVFHHNLRHQDGGSDEINVTGLCGELADPWVEKMRVHQGQSSTEQFYI